MDNLEKKVQVAVQGLPGNADASPVVTLIFSTLCVVFFALTMGWLGPGAGLAIGILQLSVFISYTLGGYVLITRGDAFSGNIFLVFATFFGGVGGFANTAGAIATFHGMDFSFAVMGWGFIVAGIFLLVLVPFIRYFPKTNFMVFLFGGLGVLGFGLTGAGLAPAVINYPSAWCLLICGLVGFYNVIVGCLGFIGIEIKAGSKPFFTPPQA